MTVSARRRSKLGVAAALWSPQSAPGGAGSWGMLGRMLECSTVDDDDADENEERETASLTMQCMTSNNMLQGKLEQENHLREHQTLTLKI